MIDIIIPTYNNIQMLNQCLDSIFENEVTGSSFLNKVYVVNNGDADGARFISKCNKIEVIQMDDNFGWEGGLEAGLARSKAEFVMFMNDDVFVMPFSSEWLTKLVRWFAFEDVAATGPCTNVVMGRQNCFIGGNASICVDVSYLIGFCMLVRRKFLDEVGGVAQGLPGGDDLDLSMRFTKAGYRMINIRNVFVYHHGFQTGQRVHGDHWNSKKMQDDTNHELIRRNGMRAFHECLTGKNNREIKNGYTLDSSDIEGDTVREFVQEGTVLELGCGGQKTVEDSVGIDLVRKDEEIPYLGNTKSVADIQADVTETLPLNGDRFSNIIARHVLEHCIDPIETLKMWSDYLEPEGQLIVAVPDQERFNTIPLNPEHVHGYTPDSLDSFAKAAGMIPARMNRNEKGISFVKVYKKL